MPGTELIIEPAVNGEARVAEQATVKLRITIGRSGQSAQTIISVKGRALITRADSFTEDLGKGATLDGKLLHATTVITDVSAAHNDVSYRVELLADEKVIFYTDRARTLATHGGGLQVTSYISILTL